MKWGNFQRNCTIVSSSLINKFLSNFHWCHNPVPFFLPAPLFLLLQRYKDIYGISQERGGGGEGWISRHFQVDIHHQQYVHFYILKRRRHREISFINWVEFFFISKSRFHHTIQILRQILKLKKKHRNIHLND